MAATSVEPPILHVDGLDVSCYDSLEGAGVDMESYDIDEGTWYDRNGLVLQASAPKGRAPLRIVVVVPDEPVAQPDTLANSLRQHLKYVSVHRPAIAAQVGLTAGWADAARLNDLVDMSVKFEVARRSRPRLPRRLWERATRRR